MSNDDNIVGLFGGPYDYLPCGKTLDKGTSWTRPDDVSAVAVDNDLPELQMEVIQMIQLAPLAASVHEPAWPAFGAYAIGNRGDGHLFLPGVVVVLPLPASIG